MGFDSIVWLVAVAGFLLLEAATTALVSICSPQALLWR